MKRRSIIFLLLVSIFIFASSASAMVQVIQREINDPSKNLKISIPQILGMENIAMQSTWNSELEAYAREKSDHHLNAIANLSLEHKLSRKKGRPWEQGFIKGNFVVTYDNKNILSIVQVFDIFAGSSRIEHFMRGVTVNTTTGQQYKLADLFLPEKDYKQVIDNFLNENIATRNDKKFIKFTGITDEQEFYLEPENLVIFFGMYTLDKTSSDITKFSIPLSSLSEYLNQEKFK